MADENRSRDVNVHREHSGSTSPPPLPRRDNEDNVCPVPLWERDFCRYAYGIPWETFCENKRFNALYKNVLDWDDSGAFKNFEEAKERFRAQYNGEPYEYPVLDPDMYIDEVDHLCTVRPESIVNLDKIAGLAGLDLVANLGNKKPEAVRAAQPYCTRNNMNSNFFGGGSSSNWHQQVNPGHMSSRTEMKVFSGGKIWISGGMKWTGGGGGGGGSGSGGGGGNGRNWNGGGGGNGRNQNGGGGGGGHGRSWNCFGGGSGSGSGRIWSGGGGSGGKQRN